MNKMPWNKGFTKETHPSVMKISSTMRERKINNFRNWHENLILSGAIKIKFEPFPHTSSVAELFGVVLGDGNISVFPRCERLIISSNSSNDYFINRYAKLTQDVFQKKPTISKTKANCVRISLYERKISERLSISSGSRHNLNVDVPSWILAKENFAIACLKGLYEAEGSLSIHAPTYTYNFQFANHNRSLLSFVNNSLIGLGFRPESRNDAIRLRKRLEVEKFRKLIHFRGYN